MTLLLLSLTCSGVYNASLFTSPLTWFSEVLYGSPEERRLVLGSRILAAVVKDPVVFWRAYNRRTTAEDLTTPVSGTTSASDDVKSTVVSVKSIYQEAGTEARSKSSTRPSGSRTTPGPNGSPYADAVLDAQTETKSTSRSRSKRTIFNRFMHKSVRIVRLNGCVSLMVCDKTRMRRSYRNFGVKVNRFFRYPTWDSDTPASHYAKIARIGRHSGSCLARFTHCQRPLRSLFGHSPIGHRGR